MDGLFFELLQVALGSRERLSQTPAEGDWLRLYRLCQMQSVTGVVFPALENLNEQGQKPPLPILYEWIGVAEQIRQQNKVVNRNAANFCGKLEKEGFASCILKGQGNNLLYPNPYLRISGDIDVWVMPNPETRSKEEDVRRVIAYFKRINPEGNVCYHHIDYGKCNGSGVEVHYRPSFMFNPIHDRRLQKWFLEHAEEQFAHSVDLPDGAGAINVPTVDFNIVFQLTHIYNHLLHEGIGLRQVIDYFYLLQHDGISKKDDVVNTLRLLGLEKIAGAVMWVMNEILGLPEHKLIFPKDEKRGWVLLAEIMRGGNFGYYDSENQKANTRVKKNVMRFKRDLRMMCYFPSECLWEPFFRVYHYFWRMKYN